MSLSLDTRLVHHPDPDGEARPLGSITPPLFQTSTFRFETAEQGGARFAGEESGYIYSRLRNPTTRLLELAMADLEGAEEGLAFASGMAAISAVLIGLIRSGDHILASRGVYGCTFGLLTMLKEKFDVDFTLCDLHNEDAIRAEIRPRTRVVYIETPVNPTMELVDIQACARVANESGARLVVDNTFSSPVLQRPIELGADVVVHSATKYLGGHGDLILGVAAGPKDLLDAIRMSTQKDIGGIAAPFDAWLVLRGLKTLSLRMTRHVASALEIAERLERHPSVDAVYYPGLLSHPQRALYLRQMSGAGGVISFIVKGGLTAGIQLMNRLELCERAVSLGETHTLIQHPASMTHSPIPVDVRRQMGIDDGLIRLSVGLEDVEDIWADLDQALQSTNAANANSTL